ncbi:GNAT family N-acetyltransferase [Flagellimonas pacifica]|uniref:Ribosomal protein S18 acetylase RimI n=1 Tax=Flagellimonas pacifica TaxID=1247520 RepID=A0A285MVC1_9FLAO|nr:GNAT family N-acetyltransferase [Allomuricauda parva]SNZ00643.1 Ribosomal protein S18 acetylase RimI [Allomuricauda parva]
MEIRNATSSDLELIVPLFDAYRVFYDQESNFDAARLFLKERFSNNENVIFLAMKDDAPLGFTQLYTTFSSVSLKSFYILNDLFVIPEFRKKGVGEALLNHAKQYCQELNYKGLALETGMDNPAQKLYERLEWEKDTDYFHYFWKNPAIN